MKNIISFFLLAFIVQTLAAQSSDVTEAGQYFNSFDGTKIYYEVKGNGEPVILIHGFVVNSESWKKTSLYNDLLEAGFKVITLDLRGNGKSGKPHKAEAYLDDAEAKDIRVLADHLKLTGYSVVGYSRGSIIASRLLVLDTRVTKTVLGGMGSDFTNPQWPRRIMFYEALSGKPVPELESFLNYIKSSGLDQQALAFMQNGQPSTSPAQLSKVKKPVLVICGDQDEDNGSSKTLSEMIPASQYVRVPGVHNDTARTQAFADEVISFLKK
jgi:pimeloyl-ACP methyl ester carboxylesterase